MVETSQRIRSGFFRKWCAFFALQKLLFGMELAAFVALYVSVRQAWGESAMLVERGMQVMNVEVVGDAYAIASNYLRRTGAIADPFATNDRLLEIIVQMFQRGELNKIRLANKAIAKFEATELV
jgi:hypothetical protein